MYCKSEGWSTYVYAYHVSSKVRANRNGPWRAGKGACELLRLRSACQIREALRISRSKANFWKFQSGLELRQLGGFGAMLLGLVCRSVMAHIV